MNITYRKAKPEDIRAITEFGLKLYGPENTFESLYKENEEILSSESQILFLAEDNDKIIGFADCSLRDDYVEGTHGGVIGYLEGIYIDPPYRMKGIAKALVSLCEDWAREKGCKEFASDCELYNDESYRFHLKIGFKEANRLICFVKEL